MMGGVTYDTGALIAAERNDRAMWELHAGFLDLEVAPVVPAPVLAEAWRGGARQAMLARLLGPCVVEAFDAPVARRVGVLAGSAHHDDIVDVAVVEGAIRRDDVVVTSNRTHIENIADFAGRRLTIEEV
jgi:hypothetical protein